MPSKTLGFFIPDAFLHRPASAGLCEQDLCQYVAYWIFFCEDKASMSKLDFVQLRSIAEHFSEALQQDAWDFNQISLQVGR